MSISQAEYAISISCEFCLKGIKTDNEPQKGNILQFKHSRTCTTALHFPFTPAPKSIPKYSRHSSVWAGSHLGIMLPNAIRGYIQGNGFNLPSGTSATALPGTWQITTNHHVPLLPLPEPGHQQFPPVWGTPSGITALAVVTCSGAAGTSVFTEPSTVRDCLKAWSLLKTNWNTKFASSPTRLLLPTSGKRPGRLLRQPPNSSGSSFKPQVFHSWRTGMMSYKS